MCAGGVVDLNVRAAPGPLRRRGGTKALVKALVLRRQRELGGGGGGGARDGPGGLEASYVHLIATKKREIKFTYK